MKKYDYIVVGAGLAGLSASLELALNEKKVLLIEQHNIPGGCSSSFCRGRFERQLFRRIRRRIRRFRQLLHENQRICALLAQIHPSEIEKNAVNPRKECASPVILPDLGDHLRERAEDKVFRIRRVLRDLICRSQKPVTQLGHQPLRPAFAVKRNLFPNLHSVFMFDAG